MGNQFARAKDPNQLDFKGIYTENFNSEIPYLNKLQNESSILANNLTKNLNNLNRINNKKMYNAFNAQESDNNFSDTSSFYDTDNINNSATSAPNSEIKQMLNKIQKGGSFNYIDSVDFINNDNIEQLLTETSKNQSGGGLDTLFLNEDMLKNLMTKENQQTGGNSNTSFLNENMLKELITESNQQSGGFFWNKKKTSKNETFINEETFNKLMTNNIEPNATSEIDTDFNNYMNNAVSELTSVLEDKLQKGGGTSSSISQISDDSENTPTIKDSEQTSNTESKHKSHLMTNHDKNTYSSSSAHTNEIDSNMSSTASEVNDKYLSDSINTSDINMISVE